jgi:hypothetical protein
MNIINSILTYVLVFSIVHIISVILQVFVKIRQENPEPINLTKFEKICLYFEFSFVITKLFF